MLDQNTLIFLAAGLIGLGVMVFGFKFTLTTRKIIETLGAVIFHVGVFGILFLKVPLSLFVSLVALLVCLFILIDPLKISAHLNSKIYKLFGFIALFIAVIFALEYLTGFPVWLWIVPIVLYLIPYVIPPIKKIAWFISLITWLLIFSYVGINGYVLYSHLYPETDPSLVSKVFPQLKMKTTKVDMPLRVTTPKPTPPQPTPQPKPQPVFQQPLQPSPQLAPQPEPLPPLVQVLQPIEQEQPTGITPQDSLTLQKNYDELKRKYDELLKENEELKKETAAP